MNLALFGGTFDPIHKGHLALARAAADRFNLKQVHFVPADLPPHKRSAHLAAFAHRYAMISLATAGEKRFVPSLLEAQTSSRPVVNYSIETVRRFKQNHMNDADRLFFIVGIDAFIEIATWRDPEALLRETEFIVASRPGYSLGQLGAALPQSIRPSEQVLEALGKQKAEGVIALEGIRIHLLGTLDEPASATAVRLALRNGTSVGRYVPPTVAEYIKKQDLYRGTAAEHVTAGARVLEFKPKQKNAKRRKKG